MVLREADKISSGMAEVVMKRAIEPGDYQPNGIERDIDLFHGRSGRNAVKGCKRWLIADPLHLISQ